MTFHDHAPASSTPEHMPSDPVSSPNGTAEAFAPAATMTQLTTADTVPPGSTDARPMTGTEREAEVERPGPGKAKTAVVVAGVAAVANKVRQEAPKKIHELRGRRAEGRCVIVTEADGRYLAIGPYKNEGAARQDTFKVGGTPTVVEMKSQSAFFEQTPDS